MHVERASPLHTAVYHICGDNWSRINDNCETWSIPYKRYGNHMLMLQFPKSVGGIALSPCQGFNINSCMLVYSHNMRISTNFTSECCCFEFEKVVVFVWKKSIWLKCSFSMVRLWHIFVRFARNSFGQCATRPDEFFFFLLFNPFLFILSQFFRRRSIAWQNWFLTWFELFLPCNTGFWQIQESPLLLFKIKKFFSSLSFHEPIKPINFSSQFLAHS